MNEELCNEEKRLQLETGIQEIAKKCKYITFL